MNPAFSPVIFVLSAFIGYQLIKRIPSLLYTPLMSGLAAILGVALMGALMSGAFLDQPFDILLLCLGVFISVFAAAGGLIVTDRALKMFSRKKTGSCQTDPRGEAEQP